MGKLFDVDFINNRGFLNPASDQAVFNPRFCVVYPYSLLFPHKMMTYYIMIVQ